MDVLLQKFERHIRELERFTPIPSDWVWWDRRDRKFKRLFKLDEAIVQDILDLYYQKWIEPFEAFDVYELTQKLGSELKKITQVVRSISRFSYELEDVRNQQLNSINQPSEAHQLNLIIGAIDHHLKEMLIHIATTLHQRETESLCRSEIGDFVKKLMQEPHLRNGLTGIYAVGKILNHKTQDDLLILITGRHSTLLGKGRIVANFFVRLKNRLSKRLIDEVLGGYAKPKLSLTPHLMFNDPHLFKEHLGGWVVFYERKLSTWEKFVWWVKP